MKNTKIVCTIGPASHNQKILMTMCKNGMNAARINTAHGTQKQYKEVIDLVRSVADVPVILDIKGPELRLRAKEERIVKRGDTHTFGFSRKYDLHFSYNCHKHLRVGDKILIEDGKIEGTIVKKGKDSVSIKFITSYPLKNNKNVSVPNRELHLPALSKKDKEMITFAKKEEIEYIALSFARNARDVIRVKRLLGKAKTGIIAKIENREGVTNIDEIIESAEGIMVARGDMGVEMLLEEVPMVQKRIIRKCNAAGKLVITATQMLDSMIENERPTRAEASDVANAILDGTDAVMLSGETATGKHPAKVVKVMNNIAQEAEKFVKSKLKDHQYMNISDAITKSIHELCKAIHVDTIVSLTHSGYTARMMSRFREHNKIIALTPYPMVKRQLELHYGVVPLLYPIQKRDRILHAAKFCVDKKILKRDEVVIFTAGLYTTQPHASNLVEVHHMKELITYTKKKNVHR